MVDWQTVAQSVAGGLLLGGVYALVALGLNLIFGVMKVINFAHGTFMMLGMYASYWLFTLYGIDPYPGILLVAPLFLLLGVLVERVVVSRILDAPEHDQLLVTLGVSLFLQNLALALFKADPRSIRPLYADWSFSVGGVVLSAPRLGAFLAALALAGLFFWLLRSTDLGKAMRAAAEEREGAILVGIDVRWIYALAFGIGTALVAVAGSIVLPFFTVSPSVGETFLLTAFITVVLGGLGSFPGALIGGLLIGLVEGLGALLPGSLRQLPVFILFVLSLLVRPQGLLGSRQ